MLRKIVIATSTVILCANMLPAFADAVGAPYIGAEVGGLVGSWNVQDNFSVNRSFSSRGAVGTLLVGFGEARENCYLGGEIYGNYASNKSGYKTINNGATSRRIKQTYSYGASFIPGLMATDGVMLYGRIGAIRTRFQIDESGTTSNSSKPTLTGLAVGAGVQAAAASNVDIRGEYVYSTYKSYSNRSGRFSPHNGQINLGIIYKMM
jgi:opacity protein-like surface antigen